MKDIKTLLNLLSKNNVKFVIVGGFAAVVHGSSMVTEDIDFCTSFDRENMKNLMDALKSLNPRHRLIKEDRPISESAEQLAAFKNLYLTTDLGYIDLLGNIMGVGDYKDVEKHSVSIKLFDIDCKILDMDSLIKSKKLMGRYKDKQVVLELMALKKG